MSSLKSLKLNSCNLLRNNLKKIENKNILMRVDFNVDFENGEIFDTYRIESVKKTLNFLKPAKRIVLLSHLDDPQNKDPQYSFKKLIPQIERILKIRIGFLENFYSQSKEKISLFENLRFWSGEKNCDWNFAKKLASLGEIFINEAFSVSHRKHSSIYLLPKLLPIFYGLNFEKEINLLNKVLKTKKSLALILGGAKISTKLPLIKKFLRKADLVFLGGGLANTFLKAKGFEVGESLVEKDIINKIKKIKSGKILIPFDFYNQNLEYKILGGVAKTDILYDLGPESLRVLSKEIKRHQTIVWNGPLGYVENKNFEKGTLDLARFLLKLKKKFILVGGGDTLAFLQRKRLLKKFKNISTGGGAMLDYLSDPRNFIGLKCLK